MPPCCPTPDAACSRLPGQGMLDLNTKQPGGAGRTLTSAQGINDDGWIVGFGTRSGSTRAWLMKPKLN